MARPISVKLYDSLNFAQNEALADMDINPTITAISWTHTLPGGPNTLSVGIVEPEMRAGWGRSYGFIPEAIGIKPFAHVVVSVGGLVCWEGQIREDEIGPLGAQAFVADGYGIVGTNTDYYQSTSAVETTTGDILDDIITARARLLTKGLPHEWTDPSVTHTRAEFDEMTLAEALDLVISEGGSGYVTWDWWVTIGRRLALLPRIAPETPEYVIPYEPESVTIRRDYREIATTAKVAYTDGGVEFETADETRSLTINEFRTTRRIRIQADEMSSTTAQQIRAMELERRSAPTYAITVSRGPSDEDWLTAESGAPVPHWAVMAGEWVKVADLAPQIIVSVQYDPASGLQLELGAPSRLDFHRYLATTCAEVNKMAKSINPITGGRRRGIRQQSAVTALTAASGTYDGTVADVGGSFSQTTLNNNFRDVADTINSLRTELRNAKVLP